MIIDGNYLGIVLNAQNITLKDIHSTFIYFKKI